MGRITFVAIFLALSLTGLGQPRNVVLIVADDLGWGDLSCYGSGEIKTPCLDKLARRGTRFTQFYAVAPVCSPSRASLLTGLRPPRSGILQVLHPRAKRGLLPSTRTLAEILGAEGFCTAAVGKWHLGDSSPFLPREHGFDEFFGILYSNDMWPLRLIRNGEIIDESPTQAYLMGRFTDAAIDFIEQNREERFFLYLAPNTPHYPLAVPRTWRKGGHSVYLDVVENMDWNLGRILSRLDDLGLTSKTLVVMTSDNGSWRQRSNGGLRGAKKTIYEGGVRVPLIISWPGRVPEDGVTDFPAEMCDLLPTIALLAGADVPEDLDGRHLLKVLGRSAGGLPGREGGDPIFFFLRGRVAGVRSGPWKLFLGPSPASGRGSVELFDLVADPGERHNLVDTRPKVAERLHRLIREYVEGLAKDNLTTATG